jgi:hypothetical protein
MQRFRHRPEVLADSARLRGGKADRLPRLVNRQAGQPADAGRRADDTVGRRHMPAPIVRLLAGELAERACELDADHERGQDIHP